MTPPILLTELAERVEKLTGPCRETDREILFATFPKDRVAVFDGVKHISTMTGRDGEPWFNPLADRNDCPYYTASLDAAMTLVPDGHYWAIDQRSNGWIASLNDPRKLRTFRSKAVTEIQARLSAILRARAASESPHG